MEANLNESSKLLNSIITKSWEDQSFKENLILKPEITISKFLKKDLKLPEGKRIAVEDQTDENHVYLNIPQKIDIDSLELSMEELEMVAGGSTPGIAATAVIAVAGYLTGRYIL